MSITGRSYNFTHAIVRIPSKSVVDGLNSKNQSAPNADRFLDEHIAYTNVLQASGVQVTVLPKLEQFPDSVFVEDAALCLAGTSILLRPGAPTRFGESEAIRPELAKLFSNVIAMPGPGFVDGGDVLATDSELFVGLSARTDQAGFDALSEIVEPLGYKTRLVNTPPEILHFKTDCGLLDSNTIFSTQALADTGCFEGYNVITAPEGEEAAANLVRFNECVLVSAGYNKTLNKLNDNGYSVVAVASQEAAKIDGGLSCMSLRFSI